MKNVKRIEFRLVIEGNGVVNFDSKDQRFVFNGTKLNGLKSINTNVNYAKKNFYNDENGELSYKLKISPESLRHHIFSDQIPFQTPAVRHDDITFISFLATPVSLIRGYMDTLKSEEIIKRKGPLTITSAEQKSNAVSYLEFSSRSGEKESDKENKDTTLYSKESVGDIVYEANGTIDVRELGFLSCDKVFGRYGINPDNFDLYKMLFKAKMPSYDGDLGYYQMKSSCIRIPEYGIKIGNETINDLVRWLMVLMLQYHVSRSGSYARRQSLEYRYITDGINLDANPWITLKSLDDVNAINFEVDDNYELEDKELAEKLRSVIDLNKLKAKADKKQAKLTRPAKASDKVTDKATESPESTK